MKNNILKVFTGLAYSIIYFPILVIGLLSFNKSVKGYSFTGFTFNWYVEIFRDDRLLEAITNTLLIAFLSTIIATIIGTFRSEERRVGKECRL